MHPIKLVLWTVILWFLGGGCGELERSNPYDVAAQGAEPPIASIALQVPMAKALAIVVYRIEAVLAGPGSPTITKELDISPLGPATGIIGTSAPGPGFSLSLRGYDTDGELLFEGGAENITIVEGDTVLVEVELFLVREIPGLNDGTGAATDSTEVTDTPSDTTGSDNAGEASEDAGSETTEEATADATTDTESGGSDAESPSGG